MPKQFSTVLPDELAEEVHRVLEERRKTDPMVTRATVMREIIRKGLASADSRPSVKVDPRIKLADIDATGKPLSISHAGKPRA